MNAPFAMHVDAKKINGKLPWSSFVVKRKLPEAENWARVEPSFVGFWMDAEFTAEVFPIDIKVECNYDASGFFKY